MTQLDLVSTEDLYEDDNLVLIKSIFRIFNSELEKIDVAIKDECGDIVKFITVKSRLLWSEKIKNHFYYCFFVFIFVLTFVNMNC